jgi:hypothetical protein
MPVVRGCDTSAPRLLVIACGALAKEIVALRGQLKPDEGNLTLQCLPADYHNTPHKIAPAVEAILKARSHDYEKILIGYGECGTGGALDAVLEKYNAQRLPFAHCYEFFSGSAVFNEIVDEEIGSFFLTDYLTKNFERLVIVGLGLDRFPHLRDIYFGNYTRIVYLAQTRDLALKERAAAAASRLGLDFEYRYVGYGELETYLVSAVIGSVEPGGSRDVSG